ncbi:MAG TPA: hypothetical protein VFE51_16515, partial [Verrucomicrobiae bacterium]|nr:hypothetical protein [Verrucomicrobiae bacterium]
MDQKLYSSQDAFFEVMAVGQNLSYQWFFQNTNGAFPIANATNAQVVIPAGDCNRCGLYWATVTAAGWLPGQTVDTRMATLTLTQPLANTTNGIDQEILRLGSNGKAPCCSGYCGFVNFYNGGLGWQLSTGQQFLFSISQAATGQTLATGSYCVQWTSTTGA